MSNMTKEKGRQWDGKSRVSNETYRQRWQDIFGKKKPIRQRKENNPIERKMLQDYFMKCRHTFLDKYDEQVITMEDDFPLFAVDKTQVPCLLTMDIINNAKANMTEKEFKSYRAYVEDVLNGWKPPVKFDVIEGGKK
jgi:hypothetical protein